MPILWVALCTLSLLPAQALPLSLSGVDWTALFEQNASTSPVSATASDWTAYLRIASISIAAYDFLCTIPAEFRLYTIQPHVTRMSRACVLFILVRYVSVAAITTSNIGFFGEGFTAASCRSYQLVAPLLKMFATLISQVIIGMRAWAISRKSRWTMWVLTIVFIASLPVELLANSWQRQPVQNTHHNCTSGNLPEHKVAWLHYMAATIYDVVAMSLSTFFLLRHKATGPLAFGLSQLMLKEGMVYFFALTVINSANMILFRVGSIAAQSSVATLGQAVTMIMSQRIILGLHEWRSPASSLSHQGHNVRYFGGGGHGHEAHQLSNLRSPPPSGASSFPALPVDSGSRIGNLINSWKGTGTQADGNQQRTLDIRVDIQEEVKKDYYDDSIYTRESPSHSSDLTKESLPPVPK